ncbi:MAG: hypothetical protein N4A62_17465 [Marinisporobacter sp.]|nr:hypothetical protein [Marinisporobacter sp.]
MSTKINIIVEDIFKNKEEEKRIKRLEELIFYMIKNNESNRGINEGELIE